jgi:hypothetical protein
MVKGTGDYLNDERERQRQPMPLKAVSQYKEPGYPVQEYLREHPELLRLVPKRWRGNATVLAVLGMAAMLICSCRDDSPRQIKQLADEATVRSQTLELVGSVIKNRLQYYSYPNRENCDQHCIAPLFLHGQGIAAYGCVAVLPPAYLTEDEAEFAFKKMSGPGFSGDISEMNARQIIDAEARKVGIVFGHEPYMLNDVDVPITSDRGIKIDIANRLSLEISDTTDLFNHRSIELDGIDAERRIGYFYVSDEDYAAWRSGPQADESVYKRDFRITADRLRVGLTSACESRPNIGVFYYPAANYNEERLRLQVRDFIQWLKAQGII